jgi:hypothetical protein
MAEKGMLSPPTRKRSGPEKIRRVPRESYDKYLTFVLAGASPSTSLAATARVHPLTWRRWFNRGYEDLMMGKCTIYRSFYEDTMVALCEARTIAELQVKQANPLKYLTSGPGKRVWEADHPEDVWNDDQELSIRAAVEHSGLVKHSGEIFHRPAPVSHLAHAFLLLEEMGLRPDKLLEADAAPVEDSPAGVPAP